MQVNLLCAQNVQLTAEHNCDSETTILSWNTDCTISTLCYVVEYKEIDSSIWTLGGYYDYLTDQATFSLPDYSKTYKIRLIIRPLGCSNISDQIAAANIIVECQ